MSSSWSLGSDQAAGNRRTEDLYRSSRDKHQGDERQQSCREPSINDTTYLEGLSFPPDPSKRHLRSRAPRRPSRLQGKQDTTGSPSIGGEETDEEHSALDLYSPTPSLQNSHCTRLAMSGSVEEGLVRHLQLSGSRHQVDVAGPSDDSDEIQSLGDSTIGIDTNSRSKAGQSSTRRSTRPSPTLLDHTAVDNANDTGTGTVDAAAAAAKDYDDERSTIVVDNSWRLPVGSKRPRSKPDYVAVDDGSTDKSKAVPGSVDLSKLRISYDTVIPAPNNPGKLLHHRIIRDWRDKHPVPSFATNDTLKALNGWRDQILRRAFPPIREARAAWLQSEEDFVLQLLIVQFDSYGQPKWNRLTNEFNEAQQGLQQGKDSILASQWTKSGALEVDRIAPWRTMLAVSARAKKMPEYAKLLLVAESANANFPNEKVSAHDESGDDKEIEDPNPIPLPTVARPRTSKRYGKRAGKNKRCHSMRDNGEDEEDEDEQRSSAEESEQSFVELPRSTRQKRSSVPAIPTHSRAHPLTDTIRYPRSTPWEDSEDEEDSVVAGSDHDYVKHSRSKKQKLSRVAPPPAPAQTRAHKLTGTIRYPRSTNWSDSTNENEFLDDNRFSHLKSTKKKPAELDDASYKPHRRRGAGIVAAERSNDKFGGGDGQHNLSKST